MNQPAAKLLVLTGNGFACIRVIGRANFSSSIEFKTLVNELQSKGLKYFVIELSECALMDSTKFNGGGIMKVKELVKILEGCKQDRGILFSSDEELNCLRKEGQIGENEEAKSYYIYGLDGTEA